MGLCPVPKKDEKGERGRGKKENRGNGKKLERNISVHHNLAQIIIGSILAMVQLHPNNYFNKTGRGQLNVIGK